MSRIARTSMLIGAAAVAAVALSAGPASAHVTVNPKEAGQGGFAKLTFRVPNEKDAADTTKVEVALPMDTPLGFVSYKPTAGWTTVVTRSTLAKPIKTDDGEVTEAVSRVTWTADLGKGIKPGQFQEFDLSVGPLPETTAMTFKALQTYSDGEVVRWIDEGGMNAEHPAPLLKLTPAAPVAPTVDAKAARTDRTALGLAAAALAASLIGLLLGGLALTRARRTAFPSPAADREDERETANL